MREAVDVKLDKNRREKAPLYLDGESVKGVVTVRPKDGKRLEHTGIKVQFIGMIGMWFFPLGGNGRDASRTRTRFSTMPTCIRHWICTDRTTD